MPRSYSDEEIASALAVVKSCKGNVVAAAKETGIPRKTLSNWARGAVHRVARPSVARLGQKKQRDLAAKCEQLAWQLAEAIPKKIKEAPLSQVATSFGIVTDKMRLLREQSTAITDNRTQIEQLVLVLSAKYKKPAEAVRADLVKIRPEMAQYVEPEAKAS